jgi:hypothetical protein
MEEDQQPKMTTLKRLYEDMSTAPSKMSMGHTTQDMKVAGTMFAPPKAKKMAKGGCDCRGDGIAQRGKTRGRMV